MLQFFFTREHLPTITTQEASPFKLKCAAEFKDGIIPFSHMYITSDSYLKQIRYTLEQSKQNDIVQVSERQSEIIFKQSNFPPNITEYKISSIAEYKTLLGNKHEINIVIVNGIGGEYGDNYIGLAILQRLSKLLAPCRINFHLMHSLDLRFSSIYQDNLPEVSGNIICQSNVMQVEKFMSMDAYIDLSGIVNYAEFGELSRSNFLLTAFSLENLVRDKNIQARLVSSSDEIEQSKKKLQKRFATKKPIALIHLISSTKIKSAPIDFTKKLISDLIKQDFNVISPYPVEYSSACFCDCSDLAYSIKDLTLLIASSDCVISTGALSMNIAASLGKPTILLPITKSNIRTAKKLPEILIWLTHNNKDLYIDTVKTNVTDHSKIAQKIWTNLRTHRLAIAAKEHSIFFNKKIARSTDKIIPKRIAVIIPFHLSNENYSQNFHACIDALCEVNGFDALWLEIIDCRFEHVSNTYALNSGINKAIKNNCDYIWLLDANQQPMPNYLTKVLKRFDSDPDIAIVAGMQIDSEDKNRAVWCGSNSSFPKQQYKVGRVDNDKLNTPAFEHWVPLQSAIIKTSAAIDVGSLDESMQNQFSDADYCFRVKERGWKVVYEPKSRSYKFNLSKEFTNKEKEALASDLKHFYHKWRHITGCNETSKLHDAILKKTQLKAKKHSKKRKSGKKSRKKV